MQTTLHSFLIALFLIGAVVVLALVIPDVISAYERTADMIFNP